MVVVVGLQLTSAALTEQPHNTVVVEGQSTELYCQTTSRNTNNALLSWKFTSVDGADQKFINNDDGVNPEYSARNVSVLINDTTGYSRLIFTSTRLGDAGTYTCQDGGGVGEAKAAWIAVLGRFCALSVHFDNNNNNNICEEFTVSCN